MTTLRDALSEYKMIARGENKSERTIEWVCDSTRYLNDFLGDEIELEAITPHDLRRWVAALRERPRYSAHPSTPASTKKLGASSINAYVRGVKLLFSTLIREEIIDEHPVARFKAPKAPQVVIQPLTDDQLAEVFAALGATRHPFRDRAIVALMWDSCLRLSEATCLLSDDVHLERHEIKVMGKGAKERIVPLSAWGAKQLLLYYKRERPQIDSDAFFVGNDGQRVTGQVVQLTLQRIGKRLGIKCNPHRFRHTGALGLVRGGLDPLRLQSMLGHTSLSMTQRYVALEGNDLRQVRRFSPGDRLRL